MRCLICLFCSLIFFSCQTRTQPAARPPAASKLVGGPCEICDAIEGYDYAALTATDTLPDFHRSAQKIKITGTIYQPDGKTPAEGVVLYIYHTDEEGQYQHRSRTNGPGRYTYHQGWVKTDAEGRYTFYTFLPGAYPGGTEPRHIHPLIKEPDGTLYYIDAFVFDHDPLLTAEIRAESENRGGSGVIRLQQEENMLVGRKDIILGLNVPGYQKDTGSRETSGRKIGEDVLSFTPYHVWGPDKDTRTCPVCKYGRYHGLLYFADDTEHWQDVRDWATFLEKESTARAAYLKAYVVYGNDREATKLAGLGRELNLKQLALTQVPSFRDERSEINRMKINPALSNTIILYRNSQIIDKFTDLAPTEEHFEKIMARLDETADEIFYLPAMTIH